MALSWSTKRQLKILGMLAVFFGGIAFFIIYPYFNKPATCIDGKQNGTETGVDCGGSCRFICPADVSGLVVKWVRSFSVTDVVASAVAYIENQNSNAGVRRITYEFKLYDKDQKFIATRTGETFISGNGPTVIFEGGIEVGSRVPTFTTFKFNENPLWEQINPKAKGLLVKGHDGVLIEQNGRPHLSGVITNASAVYGVQNIEVVGIVYDANGNALGVSETVVSSLAPKEDSTVYFTWPRLFDGVAISNEILPRFDGFSL